MRVDSLHGRNRRDRDMGWLVQDRYANCHELAPDTLKDLLGLVVEGKGQGVGEHNTGLPVDVVCHNSPPHMCYKAVNTVTFSFKDGPLPTTTLKEAPTVASETQLVHEEHSAGRAALNTITTWGWRITFGIGGRARNP